MTMASALPPDSELLPLVCAVTLVMGGVVALAVGVGDGETGATPPDKGLVDPLGVMGTAGAVDAGAAALEVCGDTPPEPEPDALDCTEAPPEEDPPDFPPCAVTVVAARAAPGVAASRTSTVNAAS